jgi:hypothetical protein
MSQPMYAGAGCRPKRVEKRSNWSSLQYAEPVGRLFAEGLVISKLSNAAVETNITDAEWRSRPSRSAAFREDQEGGVR